MSRLANRSAVCVFLAVAVFLAFVPTLRNGFTGYDDGLYVTGNPHVNGGLTGPNAAWAWSAVESSNWHPLTWLSHQLDCTWFGLAPAGHHFISLLLHIANTLLLFLWLSSTTGAIGRSGFVAAAFGLHPLHVESVAWVAERKDVLSTLFLMLTLLAYSGYVRKPGWKRYLLVAALLAAGLMAKPMLVTAPLLLLLLDWWPVRRKGHQPMWLLLEKLPLAGLAALSGVVTVWAQQRGGSTVGLQQLPMALRCSNAAVSYVRYLVKTALPVDLAVLYPFPMRGLPTWMVVGSLLLLASVTFGVLIARARHPWLAAGWGWYLLTLLPVIGIVQVGMQAMADRYSYVPMVGILIVVAWAGGAVGEHSRAMAKVVPVVAVVALFGCAVLTRHQIAVWKDGMTLFSHALKVTSDNFIAHDNLGVELDHRGRPEDALAHYRQALHIQPGDRNSQENYAQATFAKAERLLVDGKPDDALEQFREGLLYRPRNAFAHSEVGLILTRKNQLEAAIAELRTAIEIDSGLARAYLALGAALARSGRVPEAKDALRHGLRVDPSMVEAHYDLGLVCLAQGENQEAIAAFDEALRLQPNYGPALAAKLAALPQR